MSPPEVFTHHSHAKINLTLKIKGKTGNNYHLLHSFVIFSSVSDKVTFEASQEPHFHLTLSGPEAPCSKEYPDFIYDNLIIRAAYKMKSQFPTISGGAFHLTKHLPLSAGIGGGSSNAASALWLLCQAYNISLHDPYLPQIAQTIGADVPVCWAHCCQEESFSHGWIMEGIGEKLSSALLFPRLYVLLVNPRLKLSTKDMFTKWDEEGTHSTFSNDFEPLAYQQMPVLRDILGFIRELPGSLLAQMSGSGATCFACFGSHVEAQQATTLTKGHFPHFWVEMGETC